MDRAGVKLRSTMAHAEHATTVDAHLRGPARLTSPIVQRSMNGEVGALESLKRVLES